MRSIQDSPTALWLLDHNKKQSAKFVEDAPTRLQYKVTHPTKLIGLKCMDGRLNLACMTETPPGIILPFRHLGGRFEMGWPHFGSLLNRSVLTAIESGLGVIIFVTYHWSREYPNLGCRGFNYNLGAAMEFTALLRKEIADVFNCFPNVCTIQLGIETDEDALVLHGHDNTVLDFGTTDVLSELDILKRICHMYPHMTEQMVKDLLPLLRGNQERVAKMRVTRKTPLQLNHCESILGYGRGMDWLHEPNKALIVGPFGYEQSESLVTAAGIIKGNIADRRINVEDGLVLLVSSVYRNAPQTEKPLAIKKVESATRFAIKILKEEFGVKGLFPYLTVLSGIMNNDTHEFSLIENL